MKYQKFIPLLFLLFLTTLTIGQTRKQYLKAAEEAYNQESYYAALKYYEEALDFDSLQTDVWYQYGMAASKFNALSLAEKAFKEVKNLDEANKFPMTNVELAQILKKKGNYGDAIGYFQNALADSSIVDPGVKEECQNEITYCEWALEVVANPDTNIEIDHYGEGINTPFSEFGAISKQEDMFYTSYSFVHENDDHIPVRQYNKILLSKDGQPGQLWEDINSNTRHTAHTTFTSNDSTVFFTYCDYISDAEIRCDIYKRTLDSLGSWSKPEKLPDSINVAGFTNTEPQVSKMTEEGEEWLFFVSNRPGGKGGKDIYYSVINPDGSLAPPVNLEAINTEGDDLTPFFHYRTQTFYFSNDTRKGLGGFDIFKTVKTEDGWGEIEHTGYPLNSSLDDLHYKLSPGGARALMASNRLGSTFLEKEKESCCHDIYRVESILVEFLALTFDDWTKEPLEGVTVTLQRISRPKSDPETQFNPNGNDFPFAPERRHVYVVTADRDGYHPYRDTLYLDREPLLDEVSIVKEIYMEPTTVDLTVLTFDDYTKQGLIDATVQLFEYDGTNRTLVEEKVNPIGNDFSFKLKPGKSYIIRGSKSGYEHDLDTIPFIDPTVKENRSIERELYLNPLIIAKFLPILLYFDNDEPDNNTWATTTDKHYLETWETYYARKERFLDEFGRGLSQQKKFLVTQRLDGFFEREVKSGGEALQTFTDLLYEFLKQGNSLEIVLRGFTSPRAASDYNEKLSQRRIVSVRNHFENYKDGLLKPFLEDGRLKILEKPYGESKAKNDVSDKLDDVRNSIYGVPASLERRVEIIDVKQADDL
ncbi:MAG: hypothetical protein KDC24_03300 [Saprospiraceae bacterium]|nr:hypothetical protein [Saprospiraceae bacterium]